MKNRKRLKCFYCIYCGNVIRVSSKTKIVRCSVCDEMMEEEDSKVRPPNT